VVSCQADAILTRREFLRDAAFATGAVVAASPLSAFGQAAKSPEPKLGAQLIGKLEGPADLDPAKWPTKFNEAPMLAER
jgi:hypothetical protein